MVGKKWGAHEVSVACIGPGTGAAPAGGTGRGRRQRVPAGRGILAAGAGVGLGTRAGPTTGWMHIRKTSEGNLRSKHTHVCLCKWQDACPCER